jgi:uncharacterized protein YraI
MISKLCLAAVAALVAAPAAAAVVTTNANCRSGPATSNPVVARVSAGDTVQVRSRVSGWALVDRTARGCWISSRFISDGAGSASVYLGSSSSRRSASARSSSYNGSRSAYVSLPKVKSKRKSVASARRKARSSYALSSGRKSRRSSGYGLSSGSCPCSGRNVCIGPRGGRYCITSGGNKRYGV